MVKNMRPHRGPPTQVLDSLCGISSPLVYLPYRQMDIFGSGTAMCMVVTGQLPFADLDPADDEAEVQRRFSDGEFPHLVEQPGGDVLRKTPQEVMSPLRRICRIFRYLPAN